MFIISVKIIILIDISKKIQPIGKKHNAVHPTKTAKNNT